MLFVSLYNQLPESETKPIFKLASALPFKPKAKPKSSNKLLNNKFVVLKTPQSCSSLSQSSSSTVCQEDFEAGVVRVL